MPPGWALLLETCFVGTPFEAGEGCAMSSMPRTQQNGFIMPFLMFSVVFIFSLVTVVASLSLNIYNLATRDSYRVNAQLTADAGLDIGLRELNADPTWTGSGGEITLLDTANTKTTYSTTVTPGISDDRKVLSVVAKTYFPASSTTPKITRKYEVDLQAVTSSTGPGSVVSGVGGLVMNGNSKITGGDVIVNGTVTMANNSQIGTQTNAVNLRVAHMSCPSPPTATYPEACTTGQPITLAINAKIYADVRATNQTDGTNMFNPGLVPGGPVAPAPLSPYDRTLHPVAITKNATDADIACPNNGNVTWPANVKIIGNINFGNNCTVTLTGPTWITGNFNTGNNGEVIVSNTLGASRPVVMVDGSGGFSFGVNGKITPNSSGTGIEIRTFWSAAGCSPNCPNVTGVELANSQNIVTIDLANNGNAANTVFISQWSRVRVSNNGTLGAVAGQSIELGNNAIINFTASVPGSSNLTTTYVKRGYMRVFN